MPGYIQITPGTKYNVYAALTNIPAQSGAAPEKTKLPPAGYEAVLTTDLENPDD